MTPLGRVQAALEARGSRRQGALEWQCPAHDDQRASLSVKEGRNGKVVIHCHARCEPQAVLAALGLDWPDLFPDNRPANTKPEIVATYDYEDERGILLYQGERYFPKDFRRRRPDGNGGWIWSLRGPDDKPAVRMVLYRLPKVLETARRGGTVYVVEGEKDVHALERAGVVATTNLGGADAPWLPEYTQTLKGCSSVIVVADRDLAGRKHARKVAESLTGARVPVELVEAKEGKDAADHLAAGHDPYSFVPVDEEEDQPRRRSERNERSERRAPKRAAGGLLSSDSLVSHSPTLEPAALYGITGQVVRTLEPHTEADPAGLLLSFLTSVGNMVGPGPHAMAEAMPHPARLNVVLVGRTSKSRKGTALAQIRRLLDLVDPSWAEGCILPGLASGEALIAEVRDGTGDDDLGVVDKRRLVEEPEFARLLAVAGREGSTLSHVIRDAWDGRRLKNRTKRDPLTATGAHISVVGHITREELLRRLDDTEIANGFANRFLFTLVHRSKRLPEGGNLDPAALDDLAVQVAAALTRAGRVGQVTRSPAARELWAKAYTDLTDDTEEGLVAAVTARAEAQALRLSVAYALLDGSPVVEVEHLEAALAVWRYCEDSARLVFGDATGDPVADRLLEALRHVGADGLDYTAQSALFGRHQPAARLAHAREQLEARGLVETVAVSTGGRDRMVTRIVTEEG